MTTPHDPTTEWRETVAPNEPEHFERLALSLRDLQRSRGAKHGLGRALHFKSHAGLLGQFTTHADIPAWAKVGIFATPTTLPAYVRFSNGSGAPEGDSRPDVRGVAVKLSGVDGRKLIEGLEDARTQDFLAILSPTTPFRTPSEFVGLVLALSGSPLLALPRLIGTLGARVFSVLRAMQAAVSAPVDSLLKQRFYSALPIKWAATAVKFSFAPSMVSEPNGGAGASASRSFMDDIADRLHAGSVEFEFRVQRFLDEARTSIEDSSREWSEKDSPWVTVGKLTIPTQDPRSERGRKLDAYIEKLSFDPWHAPEDFRARSHDASAQGGVQVQRDRARRGARAEWHGELGLRRRGREGPAPR